MAAPGAHAAGNPASGIGVCVGVGAQLPAGLSRQSVRSCRLAFLAAARGNDAAAQARSLLAWARMERPAIQHLGELASALDDAPQRTAIAALQQRQYASTPATDNGAGLAEAFKHGFVWRAAGTAGDDSSLPPLYPFKLHD